MNLASWIILGIVAVIVAAAIKATFFGKKARGGCCHGGDGDSRSSKPEALKSQGAMTPVNDTQQPSSDVSQAELLTCRVSGNCISAMNCAGCSGCSANSAVARNALQPIVKEQPR